MNSQVDTYLKEGCGRCEHYRTPQCKVHLWIHELILLRSLVLECGLTEAYKWSQPCYTYNGKNILIVTAFKAYACISFFKGSLLKDHHQILDIPGKSSQAVRQLRFTSVEDIQNLKSEIQSYIVQAIDIEKKGQKVMFKKHLETPPDELIAEFKKDPKFKKAFDGLTPGRQRGYIIYFLQAKQSKTRFQRILNSKEKVFLGKGIHDDYKKK